MVGRQHCGILHRDHGQELAVERARLRQHLREESRPGLTHGRHKGRHGLSDGRGVRRALGALCGLGRRGRSGGGYSSSGELSNAAVVELDRAGHPRQRLGEDRPGPLGPVERNVRLVDVHAVADHAPGVRLDHLSNGVHRAEPTLGVSLEDIAGVVVEAIRVACAPLRLLRLAVIVPEIVPPRLDLDPNRPLFGHVVDLVDGFVDVLVGTLIVNLNLRLGPGVVDIVNLALGLVDLRVRNLVVKVRPGLHVIGDAEKLLDVPASLSTVAGHLLGAVDHGDIVVPQGIRHALGRPLEDRVLDDQLFAAVTHIPECPAVALRLFGVAVDRGLAVLDRLLDDLLGLGDLVGGVLRLVECVLHCVRRTDQPLRLIGGTLGLVTDAGKRLSVLTLGLDGGLNSLGDFTSHPAGVVLLAELHVDTESLRRILQLATVLGEAVVELLLSPASLGRGVGNRAEALSGGGEVGRGHVGKRLIHALDLIADHIERGVTASAEQGAELVAKLPQPASRALSAIREELHRVSGLTDLRCRGQPAGANVVTLFGGEHGLEVELGRLGRLRHALDRRGDRVDAVNDRVILCVDLFHDARQRGERGGSADDSQRNPANWSHGADEAGRRGGHTLEPTLRFHQSGVELAHRTLGPDDGGNEVIETAGELGRVLTVHAPELERLKPRLQCRESKVESALNLVEPGGTGDGNDSRFLHPQGERGEPLDHFTDALDHPADSVE